MKNEKHYVYILECSDKTLYTGYTNNLEERIKTHNNKKGAKYTKSRTPVKYVFTYECKDKSEACKLEYRIKQLKRKDKINLIKNQELINILIEKYIKI